MSENIKKSDFLRLGPKNNIWEVGLLGTSDKAQKKIFVLNKNKNPPRNYAQGIIFLRSFKISPPSLSCPRLCDKSNNSCPLPLRRGSCR